MNWPKHLHYRRWVVVGLMSLCLVALGPAEARDMFVGQWVCISHQTEGMVIEKEGGHYTIQFLDVKSRQGDTIPAVNANGLLELRGMLGDAVIRHDSRTGQLQLTYWGETWRYKRGRPGSRLTVHPPPLCVRTTGGTIIVLQSKEPASVTTAKQIANTIALHGFPDLRLEISRGGFYRIFCHDLTNNKIDELKTLIENKWCSLSVASVNQFGPAYSETKSANIPAVKGVSVMFDADTANLHPKSAKWDRERLRVAARDLRKKMVRQTDIWSYAVMPVGNKQLLVEFDGAPSRYEDILEEIQDDLTGSQGVRWAVTACQPFEALEKE